MENRTTSNGLQVGYAEAKNDVADVKMFASILRQLEELTSQIEILRDEVDTITKVFEKYELDTTDVLDDDGDYTSVYLKKRQK